MAFAQTLINAPSGLMKLNSYGKSPSQRTRFLPWKSRHCTVFCAASDKQHHTSLRESEEDKRWDGESLAKMAVATFAAGVLILGSSGDAMAAKSGGRVGGQAFRSRPPPTSAPRSSSPRTNNSRTNVFINPPVAPPIFGGYGFGTPFFGGWGWSPFSFFAPGPSVAIGVGGGLDFFVVLLMLGFVGSVIRNFFRRDDYDDDFYD